ncbi:conjugal transfer protein TraH [Phyllobacterium phragmitis]|uniref:Conjugal transfer protein TraH n=1 Tax=Phyllobacterium phragmitis TaxID=2670329 RepID=A0A2S9ISQ8_9HYPH|nr:conjugal transfer protein TraH [Phyllobacterium phragmitis]PRD43559.1 conjugal transfer protein TraH [Phyllobacterium phragmitis]
MIDAELVQQCANPRLAVEIVQQFVETIGVNDHLAVTVSQGDRTILVPRPTTVDEAVRVTREWIGKANVRVGLTQYPAGLGVTDPEQIDQNLFATCHNLRVGTELFGKVYRIGTKWYGNPRPEAFDDAIWAYGTGWFEGEQVFYAADPTDVEVAIPDRADRKDGAELGASASALATEDLPDEPVAAEDPNSAGIRIDLSRINAQQVSGDRLMLNSGSGPR